MLLLNQQHFGFAKTSHDLLQNTAELSTILDAASPQAYAIDMQNAKQGVSGPLR